VSSAGASIIADHTGDWRAYPPVALDAPLTAALEAFVEVGYHGATMRDVARRAGLSVPGIYHHYASKQEMLLTILVLTMRDLARRCYLVLEQTDGTVERFCGLVENLVLFHTHRRDVAFVSASEMRSLEPSGRKHFAAMRNEVQLLVDTEVERGVAEGVFGVTAPQEAGRAVVSMCIGLAQWFSPTGPVSPEEVAAWYVDFALGVVRHRT